MGEFGAPSGILLSARSFTLTIANAATTSDAFDARGMGALGLVMPAAFTGASITFEVSHDNTTFQALYDDNNAQVSVTVAVSRSYALPPELAPWRYFKIVSASAEGAARSLVVMALAAPPSSRRSTSVGGTVTVDSELPAAAALADNAATPTAPAVGAFGMVYDGATWDFMRGTAAAGVTVTEGSAAAIKTAVEVIDNAIAGTEMQVDVVAALPAGTNAIGKLAANTGVDIGDVDVTSVIPGTGATNLGKAEDAAHASADIGVMLMAVRRDAAAVGSDTDGDYSTFNVDSTGNLWVRVGIALPAGTNAIGKLAANTGVDIGDVDILSIAAGDNNIGNVDVLTIAAGDNNIGNVDIVTLPALVTGTANIGDVDVLTIAAGDNNIGNVDIVTLPALVAGTANIGDVDVLTLPALVAGTALIGAVSASNETATIYSGTTALTPKFAIIDAATSGNNTLVAAVASKKLRVVAAFLVASAAVTVRFESGADGTALTGQMQLAANGGFTLPYNPVGWFESASGVLLNLELSGALSVDGSLVYVEV